MTKTDRTITRADLLSPQTYAAERKTRRARMIELKRARRMTVGPDATFYFENYDTMLQQIQEMLHIEKGGEAQIEDELTAYNPLIPQGRELVATLMFEIVDEARRQKVLGALGGVEHTVFIRLGPDTIAGRAEQDAERTNQAGKASSVQFLHFAFTPDQVERFRSGGEQVVLGIGHENYAHMAVMPRLVRDSLAGDL